MHTHTHLLTHTYTENIYTYKQYLQKKKKKRQYYIKGLSFHPLYTPGMKTLNRRGHFYLFSQTIPNNGS